MTIDLFCQHLAKTLAAAETHSRLELAARQLAGFFGVEDHEIAFFQLVANGRSAIFRWPTPQGGGAPTIAIKSYSTALVAVTANEQRGFINNAFATTPHLHMFEHVLADREQRIPVQKIMSAPVVENGTLSGVIQVAHKGKTLADAGPDFSDEDLAHLSAAAATLARFAL